ncbi:uncharacterized protein LOC119585393 [Penaeus monodon]|uniref:uncharacterized protein LOC119585393 n=1 Tax=Penaeus monodon TaxID=6687 RepID=UPI0018A77289|nr:uncharacterized protein LOC119585393 [Penaeus monodon]
MEQLTVTERSEYCVSSETFPQKEVCDKNQDWLGLWSDPETTWELEPANMSSGCDQYHLVSLDLTLHDSPTKLLWRPGERAASLRLVLLRSGAGYDEFTFFRESSSQLQYDMTFRRVSGVLGATCVVASASLDVSCACRKNQTEINSFYVESFDDDGTKTPSYFSLDCEDDADGKSDSDTEWEVPVFAVYVTAIILLLEIIFL